MNKFMDPRRMGMPAQSFQQVSPLQALLGGQQQMAQPEPAAMQPAMNPMQNRSSDRRQMFADLLMGVGAGLASGNPAASAAMFQQMAQNRGERRQRDQMTNATAQWLKSQGREDLIPLVQSGMAQEALRMAMQKPDMPSAVQEYEYARQNGFQGSFADWKQAGRQSVTVNNMGNIPAGFEVFEDPQTGARQMRAIPGGPADIERQQAEQARQNAGQQATTASDVITTAAARAREAAQNRAFGGIGQSIVQMNPYTDSAEVARQVAVLKSNASVENLNAMRRASPTGGALGSVTAQENQMLADKSGALDPSSPTFLRDLDDYERTLLRIIHGTAEGDRIFEQSRRGGTPSGRQSGGGGMSDDIDSLVDKYRSR